MTNRAQATAPYNLDMFTTLPAGTLATFTDEGTPANYYNVIPDGNESNNFLIPANEFPKYFKYYIQSTIF